MFKRKRDEVATLPDPKDKEIAALREMVMEEAKENTRLAGVIMELRGQNRSLMGRIESNRLVMKEHIMAEMVNGLCKIADKFHGQQQLRQNIHEWIKQFIQHNEEWQAANSKDKPEN